MSTETRFEPDPSGDVIRLSAGTVPTVYRGSGSPEGVLSAAENSLYWDETADALYIKETGSGNTGWIAAGGGSSVDEVVQGSGSPEGVVTAEPATVYWDTTNNSLYWKETGSGNTGWYQVLAA
jgi:hypothetical protein